MEIRVRGRVQGVGFRPAVWRVARALNLSGEVLNDDEGVLIRVRGDTHNIGMLIRQIESDPPPLAHIESIKIHDFVGHLPPEFRIGEMAQGKARTQIAPDAEMCPACVDEILTPGSRHFHYPFTSCAHCGPRLSIIEAIPYDRARTTMRSFPLCPQCQAEYDNPATRRFHAEAIACPDCGPKIRLIRFDGTLMEADHAIEAASELIACGEILALKGIGGYQLACDATNREAVMRLRQKKGSSRPFALMARDMAVIRRYCMVSHAEESELTSARAPVMLLDPKDNGYLPAEIAPAIGMLGFMLPTTPLHLLLIRDMNFPLVMTSGNISGEPQITDDEEAKVRLPAITPYALTHDRGVAHRVDDSIMRIIAGKPRLMRRARGFAPVPVSLPEGFEHAPDILAMGGEQEAVFCLLKDGKAILSQHQGDLMHEATWSDYRKNYALYMTMFGHAPAAIAADSHPGYLSSGFARKEALAERLPLIDIQHHHAHIVSCLAENGYALNAPPVLGIALDGAGWGKDGSVWGGEFLLADYRSYQRLGMLKPVALPGDAQAAYEPWRHLYAHIAMGMGWPQFAGQFGALDLHAYLSQKPLAMLDAMMEHDIHPLLMSSCGRLFDAVAAALMLSPDRQKYEGDAAFRLEALAMQARGVKEGYSFGLLAEDGLIAIDPLPMWRALFSDLSASIPSPVIAAKFHKGLAQAVSDMAKTFAQHHGFTTVALSGDCFNNRLLFEEVVRLLDRGRFNVLSHAKVPAGDGGLALGQAAIAAAQLMQDTI